MRARKLESYECQLTSIRFFFFNDTATTEIYTLSLHDALPIFPKAVSARAVTKRKGSIARNHPNAPTSPTLTPLRSEEHTSELQSRQYLVCRLLLEKKTIPRVSSLILLATLLSPLTFT